MEVWILLAAAGSGYLARRWQNAQKPKGSSADDAEDENNAGPSNHMPSYRGRYRRFSSSGRQQVGKSLCGKGSPYWVRKNVGNAAEHKTGARVNGNDDGKEIWRGGHTLGETSSRDCYLDSGQSKGIEKENLPTEQDLNDYLSAMHLSNSRGSRKQNTAQDNNGSGGLDTDLLEEVAEGKSLADNPCPPLFKSFSGKRASDSSDDKAFKSGYLLQDGYVGKRMKDAVNSTASQEEAFAFGTWMPGFWDVSEGVFVLDTDSLLVQQEGERSKGSSSARKIRTPNKYGRSRCSRRKNLARRKPMSSLESCLSAQLDEDYNRRTIQNRVVAEQSANAVVSSLDSQSSSNVESCTSEGSVGVLRADSAIGLPSLSRQLSSKKFSKNSRLLKSPAGRVPNGDVNNPFAGKEYTMASKPTQSSAKWESFGRKGKEKCLDALHEESRCTKGSAGSSLEGLLFNFGVGVGMMFTVMSNIREVRRLTLLLKEAELLIKDLENELEGRDILRPNSFLSKNNSAGEDTPSEQRQTIVTNTVNKVRSATRSLSSMRLLLTNELETVSTIEHMHSKDISTLEAELEAELERMELSLGDEALFKVQRKNSDSSELDVEVGSLVQGDLTTSGLPHETEVDTEDEDGSDSSVEDLHVSNYAVSPRELAKRLHEVLEARSEERISSLEAELKLMGSKLQAKEEELQWLKSLGFFQGEDLPGSDKKTHQSSQNHTRLKRMSEAKGFPNIDPEEHFLHPQISRSPNASPVSPNFSPYATNVSPLNSSTFFKRGVEKKSSTAFITLGGEALAAYEEACDEFSKVSSEPARAYPHTDINTHRDAFGGGDSATAKECNVDLLHLGNSDGWEQVDLLSLAEDFYVGGDSEFMDNMPTLGSITSKGRHRHRRRNPCNKGSVSSSHPEPEQYFSSSRGVDSSDDATNDTSGSTPCSVKFMDVRTAGFCHSEHQLGIKAESEANSSSHLPYSDWSQEILICAGVNTPNEEEFHSIETLDSPGKFVPASKPGEGCVAKDNEYSSDLDEQLGQLLIKRIVEKSRKGSLIIQDAQTVLASFERNNTPQATD